MSITRRRRCRRPDLPRLARNIQTGLRAANREPLPFPDMTEHAKQILIDAFGRVRELVTDLTDGLSDEVATYRPDPGANSIAWLIWHLTRGQDHQVADLAQVEQVCG